MDEMHTRFDFDAGAPSLHVPTSPYLHHAMFLILTLARTLPHPLSFSPGEGMNGDVRARCTPLKVCVDKVFN